MRYYHPASHNPKSPDISKHKMANLMVSGDGSEVGPNSLKTPISGTPSMTSKPVGPNVGSSKSKSGKTGPGRDAKKPSKGKRIGSAR